MKNIVTNVALYTIWTLLVIAVCAVLLTLQGTVLFIGWNGFAPDLLNLPTAGFWHGFSGALFLNGVGGCVGLASIAAKRA